ncbi:MAG: hypothetical protein HYW49_14000 [Deltaproteobacteria bacterium]|nr:hypothetical protein [Deltaproteobacteria bacterium]
MSQGGLEFRATQDVDVVLLTNASAALNARIAEYVRLGRFKIKEATEGTPRYFRFRDPEDVAFPEMIEIFARNEQKIELAEGQYIIPVQKDDVARISAILLDEEYFGLIKSNCVRVESGVSIINAVGNICLKARAHREMSERKTTGEQVDEKDIKKHRNDILRIAVTLKGDEKLTLGAQAKVDMKMALDKLREMPLKQFKQLMETYPGVKQPELLTLIERVFLG